MYEDYDVPYFYKVKHGTVKKGRFCTTCQKFLARTFAWLLRLCMEVYTVEQVADKVKALLDLLIEQEEKKRRES